MAARSRVTVTVNVPAISGMFQTGGEVKNFAGSTARRIKAVAIRRSLVFSNTGFLAGSHRIAVTTSALFGVNSYVFNTASYARFKHNGTTGPIMSIRPLDRRGRPPGKMAIGKANGAFVGYRNSVSGQEGEPWLLEAGNEVLLRYGVQARQTR